MFSSFIIHVKTTENINKRNIFSIYVYNEKLNEKLGINS